MANLKLQSFWCEKKSCSNYHEEVEILVDPDSEENHLCSKCALPLQTILSSPSYGKHGSWATWRADHEN